MRVEALPGLLLDPIAVDGVTGATGMVVDPLTTTRFLYIDTNDKPECGGVFVNAARVAYAGSGWEASQAEALSEPPGAAFRHYLAQSVVSFPSAAAATKYAALEANRWTQCDGKTWSTTNAETPSSTWTVQAVAKQNGILTAQESLEGGNGWSCQRALTARNNVVIDVRSCSFDPNENAVVTVKRIAERFPAH